MSGAEQDDAVNAAEAPPARAPVTLDTIRQKYPAYQDVPDDKLAHGLYDKFYKDQLPFDQFASKIGYDPRDLATRAGVADAGQISQQQPPDNALSRIGNAAVQGAKEGFGQPSTILSPMAQEKLDATQRQGGWKGTLAQLGSTAAQDIGVAGGVIAGLGGAGLGAFQKGVAQTGQEVGAPGLGRDIAALPEAFPQESMGMQGVLPKTGVHPPGTPQAIQEDIVAARETAREARPPPEQPPAAAPAPTPPPRPLTPEQAAYDEEGIVHPSQQPAAQPAPAPPPPAPAPQPVPEPVAQAAPKNPASDFVMMRPSELKVDPGTFQFKTSDEKGVTGALQGVTKWEPALANPLTAYQWLNGDTTVVNGHQRHDLGTKAEAAGQDVQMPVRIYREADGYTPDFMRVLGAYQNIAEGSTNAIDAAKVLRGRDSIPETMVLPQLPPKSEMVRQATSLAKLSPNAFGMVENGIVPPSYAAHVGELIADPKQQEATLSLLSKAEPANANQARLIVEDARNSGFLDGMEQGGLFGDEAYAKSLIPERAKILDGATASLRKTRGLYKAAVEGEQELTAAGNQLNPEANIKAKTGNEQLLETIQRDATTKGPISDALSQAARDLAAGQPKAVAQAAFLAAVRKIVGSGEGAGVESGGVHGGEGLAEQAGLAGRPPKPPTTGPNLFGDQGQEPAMIPRRPEPTIKGDQRQQAFPGMEPTAKQAQASREAQGPRGNQLPPDQGLFARQEPVQPPLEPPKSRFTQYAGSTFRDLLPDFPNRQGGHEAAAQWVVDQGRATGNEHMAIVDNRTGEVVHAGTNDMEHFLNFDPSGHVDDPDAYTIHHNHPSNGALSGPDIGMLGWQHMSDIVAHGHGGDMFSAKMGGGLRDVRITEKGQWLRLFNALSQTWDRYYNPAANFVTDAMAAGHEFNHPQDLIYDSINRILHNLGYIDLTTTRDLPQVMKDAIDRKYPDVAPGRSAGAVKPEERLAGLSQGTGGLAEEPPRTGGPEEHPREDAVDRGGTEAPRPADEGRPQAGLGAPQPPGQQPLGVPPTPQFDVLRDKKGIAAFAASIRAAFAPASLKGAKPMEQRLRPHGSELAQSSAQSYAAVEGVRNAVDRLPQQEQIDFTDRMETGQKQPTPELQAVADVLRDQLDMWMRKIQGLGKGYLANAIHDYMGHVWGNYKEWSQGQPTTQTQAQMREQAMAGGQSKVPLMGSGAFLKQRTFPTQLEGIKKGLIPSTYNPVDLQLLKLREMQKFYHGSVLADEVKSSGVGHWVPAGMERAAADAGLVKLDDRVFQPRLQGASNPAGFGKLEPGNWYAPEPAARLFNNYMQRGLYGTPVYDTLRVANNALNTLQLGLSAFHATFVTLDTMISRVALGMQQAARGDFGKAGQSMLIGLTPYAMYKAWNDGGKLGRAWLDPQGATPEWRQLAQLYNEGGMRYGMDQFYQSSASGPFFRHLADVLHPETILHQTRQMWQDDPSIAGRLMVPVKVARRVIDTINHPLMGVLVPRAKAGVFASMARDWQEAHPTATPEERSGAMVQIGNSVDNRLGQLVYDNLYWNKIGKDLSFLAVRSVGWNIGTFRELGGGVIDTAKMANDVARGREAQLTTKMAYTMALPVMTAIYGSLINYLYTGEPPKDAKDMIFPRTGKLTPAGDPDRVNIPGYMKDVWGFAHHPIDTVLNKTSPMIETGKELRENKDYYGATIYNKTMGDNPIAAYGDYLIGQAMPFAVRGAMKQEAPGGGGHTAAALSFFGLQPASKEVTQPEVGAAYQMREDAKGYRARAKEGNWRPLSNMMGSGP